MATESVKRPPVRRKWSLEQRLDYYTDRSDGPEACWPWIGTMAGGHGELYPAMSWNNVQWRAHRLMWTAHRGWIPDGMLVCHRCDNPKCVNLEHLFLGTHADNNRDKEAKGRGLKGKNRPELTRLSDDAVRAIRASTEHPKLVAPIYGISPTHVFNIRRGKRRSYVT